MAMFNSKLLVYQAGYFLMLSLVLLDIVSVWSSQSMFHCQGKTNGARLSL